jgi:hypothetical protein
MYQWSGDHCDTKYVAGLGKVQAYDAFYYERDPGRDNTQLSNIMGFKYNFSTGDGCCGSPIISCDNRHTSPLVGYHVAGKDHLGYAAPLVRETVEEAISFFYPGGVINETADNETIFAQGAIPKFWPDGDFDVKGAAAKPEHQPDKSHLERSIIHDVIKKHITEPAVLSPHDPRLEAAVSPLRIGVEKYGARLPAIRPQMEEVIDVCFENLANRFSKCPKNRMEVLDVDTTLNGDPWVGGMDSMNMRSSLGFYYKNLKEGGSIGKTSAFPYDEEQKKFIPSPFGEKIIADMREMEEEMKKGNRVPHVWVDTVKDECRPLAKIPTGQTRVFCVGQVTYLMLGRMYCLGAMAAVQQSKIQCGIAVGMDPFSTDAHTLVTYLHEVGHKIIAGDYKAFDSNIHPLFFDGVCTVTNRMYNDEPEKQLVRKVLFDMMAQSTAIAGDCVYEKYKGNPSGNFATWWVNSCAGVAFLQASFVFLALQNDPKLAYPDAFWEHCRPVVFGDDFLLAVSPTVEAWMTLTNLIKTVEEFGMTMTPEDKSNNIRDHKTIEECTFLKCNFRQENGLWLMALSKDTIYEMTNWISRDADPVATTFDKCLTALWMAAFHGEGFYNQFRKELDRALNDLHAVNRPLPGWHEAQFRRRNCLGQRDGRDQSSASFHVDMESGEISYSNPFSSGYEHQKLKGGLPYAHVLDVPEIAFVAEM